MDKKLRRVRIGPGRYVKVRRAPEDKMRRPDGDKGRDDFTEIPGVGPSTAEALHAAGIHTFAALRSADLSGLSGRARRAVENWRG